MSPESRYRRFFAPITQLSDEQLAYLTEIDYKDHFAWIGLLEVSIGSQGVGGDRRRRMAGQRGGQRPAGVAGALRHRARCKALHPGGAGRERAHDGPVAK